MKIRNYKPQDYIQVKKLLQLVGLFDKNFDSKKKLNSKTPKNSIIVAEEQGKIIGCVFFTFDNWDSSIYRLGVSPEYQKMGIGKKLLKEAEKRLKKLGAKISCINVEIKNQKATKFYEKQGYKKIAKEYYMEKKL